ncbi:phosphorylated adapter RNA export protein [Venturia canescens]|uniref:phosphorylated adapter RNA export protein n=1 Tax=Venturia canescens TaxID=32260 RepID=UPI001C9CD0AA|nr:phosphorylated adapter RNA export protein [Venturia canescens]
MEADTAENAEILELEEGEVVDDEGISDFGSYNILQRPHIAKSHDKQPKTNYTDESEETSASASDSDSDSSLVKVKRPKVKIKRRRIESQSNRNKSSDKYKIWCTQVQEESLTENLVSCGVTKKMYQGRNVENYDFPGCYDSIHNAKREPNNSSEEDEEEGRPPARLSNKRTNADRKNVKLRLGKRRNSMEVDKQKGAVKIMAELGVNGESTDDQVAADIAEKLNEKKDSLIRRVVDIIGKKEAIEFYEETRKIEEAGGMLIMNGSRRRTAGGIYLWLVKNDEHIPQEKIREIFSMDKKQMAEQRKKEDASNRRQKTQELMRSLENGSEKDLPALLTRAELSTRQIAEEARLRRGEGMDRNLPDSERTVSNPPPSPVTDDPDHSEHHHNHHQHQNQQRQQQQQHQPPPREHHHCASPSPGQRRVQNYNDDFLDIGLDVDSMEVF